MPTASPCVVNMTALSISARSRKATQSSPEPMRCSLALTRSRPAAPDGRACGMCMPSRPGKSLPPAFLLPPMTDLNGSGMKSSISRLASMMCPSQSTTGKARFAMVYSSLTSRVLVIRG